MDRVEQVDDGIVQISALCQAETRGVHETLAFGDHFHDVSMLDLAGCPVIMENAPEPLRARYAVRCRDVAECLCSALDAGAL